jgi:hypothetical protein
VVPEPEAIEWDDANLEHATRHGVSSSEIEQVLRSGPTYRANRRGTGDYLAEGATEGGRRIRVVIAYDTIRRSARPIAAWETR